MKRLFCIVWMVFAGFASLAEASPLSSIDPLLGGAAAGEEISCRLTRVNILTGVFAEIDLGILSLKVKPYVELRFNHR